MHDVTALATQYLADFSRKDLAALEKRFAPEVTLRDPNVGEVRGRPAVLETNAKIFAGVTSIEARPLALHPAGKTAVCELEVWVDGKPALKVADVIDFDDAGLITAIRAYFG